MLFTRWAGGDSLDGLAPLHEFPSFSLVRFEYLDFVHIVIFSPTPPPHHHMSTLASFFLLCSHNQPPPLLT